MDTILSNMSLRSYTFAHLNKRNSYIYPLLNGKQMAGDCHNALTDEDSEAVVAIKDGKIVSYIVFTIRETEGISYLLVDFSCTKVDERRHGLSVKLRAAVFLYAVSLNIDYIISHCNQSSSQLLVKKFGFHHISSNHAVFSKLRDIIDTECAVSTKDPVFLELLHIAY